MEMRRRNFIGPRFCLPSQGSSSVSRQDDGDLNTIALDGEAPGRGSRIDRLGHGRHGRDRRLRGEQQPELSGRPARCALDVFKSPKDAAYYAKGGGGYTQYGHAVVSFNSYSKNKPQVGQVKDCVDSSGVGTD